MCPLYTAIENRLVALRRPGSLSFFVNRSPRGCRACCDFLGLSRLRPPEKNEQTVEALRQEAATKTKRPTAVDQPNGKEGSPGKDGNATSKLLHE
jgi:hypothetical protein